MIEDTLYTCLIEDQTDDEAFVQVYWAWGSHMGDAIEKSLSTARDNGLTNPTVREVDPYDIENLEGEVFPNSEADVFFATTRFSFPPEPSFIFPAGIVPSCIEDEEANDVDDIRAGYRRSQDEEGLIEIGVNVSDSCLLPLYERVIKLHETYKTFWYLIQGHWGDVEDQIYENPDLCTSEAIIEHLRAHRHDAVMNGFVTLTAYADEGATNVNISDHKRIVILTYSDSVADATEAALKDEGIPHHEDLVSFDNRIHHWHYRPSESLDRSDLIAHLTSSGFKPWNPNYESEQDSNA
ncbi:MAG: hypothetical protein R3F19_07480 [Verrucomicrobiales bacterium]